MWLLLWVHIHQETANPRAQDPVLGGVHTHRCEARWSKVSAYFVGYTCNPAFLIALNYEATKIVTYWHLVIHSTLFLTLVPLCYFGIMFIYVILHKYWLVFFLSFFPKIVFLLWIWFFFFCFTKKVKPLLYITKGLMLEKGNVNMYTKLTTRLTLSK